eukprot:12746977-Alexandrium_andersonii.AAC.1
MPQASSIGARAHGHCWPSTNTRLLLRTAVQPVYAHMRARATGLALFRRADGQISCKVGSDRATL